MTHLRLMTLLVLSSSTVFAPALSSAQEPAHSLQELQSDLKTDDTVRVTETDGKSVQGKIERISDTSLKLKANGVSREFREPQIVSVRKQYRDSIRNGLIAGAVLGGIAGAVLGAVVSDAFCDGCGNNRGGGALAFAALGAGVGAGTGALGDWLKTSQRTVYTMPRTSGLRINISPIASKKTKSVAVAFRF